MLELRSRSILRAWAAETVDLLQGPLGLCSAEFILSAVDVLLGGLEKILPPQESGRTFATPPQAGNRRLFLQREGLLQERARAGFSTSSGNCGHGTIFDFETKDYLEKAVPPYCAVCNTELEVDLTEQLKAYRCFYDSMSRCARVEFRVRLGEPGAVAPGNEIHEAVSAAVTEVQQAVTTALAEHAAAS